MRPYRRKIWVDLLYRKNEKYRNVLNYYLVASILWEDQDITL